MLTIFARRARRALPKAHVVAGVFLVASLAAASASASQPTKLRGALPLYFHDRPAADGSGRMLRAKPLAPVTVRFTGAPSAADVSALEALGAFVARRRDGSPRGHGRIVAAELPASAMAKVAAMARVEHVTLDGAPMSSPPPLDYTAGLIAAPDTWSTKDKAGLPLSGAGMTVCDIDSGIDIFHPLFFRADGGYYDWLDVDGDGEFTPGIDAVDVDGDGEPETLRVQDAVLRDRLGEVMFGSDDPHFEVGWDFLYADRDGSKKREYGRAAGFSEADPTYGEPLFVADDVNQNGMLDVGEKVIALRTSKIRVARSEDEVFRRGENLIDFPVIPEEAMHGTAAMSILVGGNRGLGRFVGIAPDADLVAVARGQFTKPVQLSDFCVDEGARVVLHEYAPWQGYHLDGSSDLEEYIDETSATGVSHINPAGNLSTSQKVCKRPITAGAETIIPIEAPPDSKFGEFRFLGLSLLWRDPARNLALTLEDPTGFAMPLLVNDSPIYASWHDGLTIYAAREDSNRGTAKVDVYVYGQQADPPPLPLGTWKLRVFDPAPPGSPEVVVIGAVADELSRWSKGIFFPEFPTEDHLIGFPGTADHGLAVAAFTAHDYNGGTPGERAYYSGRGHRIDGAPILWISSPDNPITAGANPGEEGGYMVFGGTSGASPHVAGAAALILQADPSLDGDGVKAAIRNGALVDKTVGSVPNDDYGWGKLRVYEAIFGRVPPGGTAPVVEITPRTIGIGAATWIPIEVSDADQDAAGLTIEIDRDYDGVYDELLTQPRFDVRYDAAGQYVTKVRVTDASGKETSALAIVYATEIHDPPRFGRPAARALEGAGGGCAVRAGAASGGAARSRAACGAALAIAALLALRVKSRRSVRVRRRA